VVAAIEGPCAGAALELAVACDVRVAGSESFFLLPSARLGLLYRPDGTAALTAELGRQTTARLMLLGDRIPAEEALAAGIVTRIVAAGEACDAAVALAALGAEGEPEALRLTKQLIGECSVGTPVGADWNVRREGLLESDSRRDAVARAKEKLAG
jgi:enoyl-CoA hydratase/carnithine racemase